MATKKLLDPIHAGEVLREEFMEPAGSSINRLSRDLRVPPNRIHAIVHGTRSISAGAALRPGAFSGVTPETWLSLQTEYDLRAARLKSGAEIARFVRRRGTA